jgi:hypothetical protein
MDGTNRRLPIDLPQLRKCIRSTGWVNRGSKIAQILGGQAAKQLSVDVVVAEGGNIFSEAQAAESLGGAESHAEVYSLVGKLQGTIGRMLQFSKVGASRLKRSKGRSTNKVTKTPRKSAFIRVSSLSFC